MRSDKPSLTALGVAIARSALERPSTPSGDPAAEARLATDLGAGVVDVDNRPRGEFFDAIAVRTRFFDDAVLRAISDGVRQIVVLGAGYDARGLRFRTPGVTFFEVDHPATQADKRARLAAIGASTVGIVFVAADFTEPGLPSLLASSGHDPLERSLLICEGVLRYLPETWFRELLRAAAEQSAIGSELAVSISTRAPDADETARRDRTNHEQRLAESGETVLTVPDREVALRWLAEPGWALVHIDDIADVAPGTRPGRLLVRARR
ncbi:MAG: class I SAM-dependent methyltransferase [Acidimicrobiia bacterium]